MKLLFGLLIMTIVNAGCSAQDQKSCPSILNSSRAISKIELDTVCIRLQELKKNDLYLFFHESQQLPSGMEQVNIVRSAKVNDSTKSAVVIFSMLTNEFNVFFSGMLKSREFLKQRHEFLQAIEKLLNHNTHSALSEIISSFGNIFEPSKKAF